MTTRSNLTGWSLTLLVNASAFAALYAWKAHGVEQAGNLLKSWLWSMSVLGWLFLFLPPEPPKIPRGIVRRAVGNACDLSMVGALAWFGHFALAAAYALAMACVAAYRNRSPKLGEVAR